MFKITFFSLAVAVFLPPVYMGSRYAFFFPFAIRELYYK